LESIPYLSLAIILTYCLGASFADYLLGVTTELTIFIRSIPLIVIVPSLLLWKYFKINNYAISHILLFSIYLSSSIYILNTHPNDQIFNYAVLTNIPIIISSTLFLSWRHTHTILSISLGVVTNILLYLVFVNQNLAGYFTLWIIMHVIALGSIYSAHLKYTSSRGIYISQIKTNRINLELKRKNKEIQKANKKMLEQTHELKLLNETKDKFFSIISHDIKGSFNSIISYSDLMVKCEDHSFNDLVNYSNSINTSAKKTFSLLENLLQWSQVNTNTLKTNIEKVDVTDVLREILITYQTLIDQKELKLRLDVDLKSEIYADRNMLAVIIRNLLTNAIKFSKKDGTIIIQFFVKDDSLEFMIKDNGVGITNDRVDKILFSDNYGSTMGTLNETGSGLGLRLCKEFIEAHHGELTITSEEGKGSAFNFSIPKNLIKDAYEDKSLSSLRVIQEEYTV